MRSGHRLLVTKPAGAGADARSREKRPARTPPLLVKLHRFKLQDKCRHSPGRGEGLLQKRTFCALIPGFENANDLCPSPLAPGPPPFIGTLQSYSSVPVRRGTEGDGVDTHRKRHLIQDYLKSGNKRKVALAAALTCLPRDTLAKLQLEKVKEPHLICSKRLITCSAKL